MPAALNESGSMICPDCGSLVLGGFCANCGFSKIQELPLEKSLDNEVEERSSIFEEANPKTKRKKDTDLVKRKRRTQLFISTFLFFLLLGISSYIFWLYQATADIFLSPTPNFIISNEEEGVSMNVDSLNGETLVDYNIGLKEGNFLQYNFAQFAAPEVAVYMEMFNTYEFLKKFYSEEDSNKYFKDFGLEEDDLNVYLSQGFAVVLPDDNFERWGYATAVIDKKYVDEKLSLLESLRVKNKAYENIYATTVTVKKTLDDETNEEDIYLLIANSKEYLDQMKEVSEGVLPNLDNSALFAQAQKALPSVGNVLIYHNKKVEFSTTFYNWFASKFDYEGLNKILENINSSTIVLYSQSEKLKIAGISDL